MIFLNQPELTLAKQFDALAASVAILAAEKRAKEADDKIRLELRNKARQKQWQTRKGAKTGLTLALIDRLPKSKDSAIPAADVLKLFADFDHSPTGVSSALTVLCKSGEIQRIGEPRHYLYYVQP